MVQRLKGEKRNTMKERNKEKKLKGCKIDLKMLKERWKIRYKEGG